MAYFTRILTELEPSEALPAQARPLPAATREPSPKPVQGPVQRPMQNTMQDISQNIPRNPVQKPAQPQQRSLQQRQAASPQARPRPAVGPAPAEPPVFRPAVTAFPFPASARMDDARPAPAAPAVSPWMGVLALSAMFAAYVGFQQFGPQLAELRLERALDPAALAALLERGLAKGLRGAGALLGLAPSPSDDAGALAARGGLSVVEEEAWGVQPTNEERALAMLGLDQPGQGPAVQAVDYRRSDPMRPLVRSQVDPVEAEKVRDPLEGIQYIGLVDGDKKSPPVAILETLAADGTGSQTLVRPIGDAFYHNDHRIVLKKANASALHLLVDGRARQLPLATGVEEDMGGMPAVAALGATPGATASGGAGQAAGPANRLMGELDE